MTQLFVVKVPDVRCIPSGRSSTYRIPYSELSEYTHLRPSEITYECDGIDDQTLESLKIIAESANIIHCIRTIPAIHNAFQTKMRCAMIWTDSLIVQPNSGVEYIVANSSHKIFPYEIADRIAVNCLGEDNARHAYERMIGKRYKYICIRKIDGPFPDLEADEIDINITQENEIPDIIAKCRCVSLRFYIGNINRVHKIDFDGRLSETIMHIEPTLNPQLQSALKQRRTDFANRRFARVKAIVN